jgi:radical SAM protein with 4Fe4S-binding SPASM domain
VGRAQDRRPIVVWNMSRACNLQCVHCYAEAARGATGDELTTEQARAMIGDLAGFGAPVLLFSGGEPTLRPDLLELGRYAREKGLRTVISTNGTLITAELARRIKEADFGYVGVSLDGVGEVNDRFRGHPGAFKAALAGIRNCVAVGQNVGLRFTITRRNADQVPAIFDLVESEQINRLCFYHLVYSGRGSDLIGEDLPRPEARALVDLIFERTLDLFRRGLTKDVLTVDNHCDGVHLYLRLQRDDPARAEEVLQLLRWNGGNASGIAIGDVDWSGNVHADQFWQQHTFGNVKQRPFSQLWTDMAQPLLAGLKDRKALLKGRCGACRHLDICNGNFRARAEAVHGDLWAPDPACYLSDEEIGIA